MSVWTVIYRLSCLTIAGMLAVGVARLVWPKWREIQEYRRRRDELAREIALEEEMIRILRRKQERFRTDPAFVERLAHDLGLARSNEVLFRIVAEPPVSAAPARVQRSSPAAPSGAPRQSVGL